MINMRDLRFSHTVKIKLDIFWVLPPPSLGWLLPEDGGSMNVWNFGILPQHYTASQPVDLDLKRWTY
jgi:hypothetical protein